MSERKQMIEAYLAARARGTAKATALNSLRVVFGEALTPAEVKTADATQARGPSYAVRVAAVQAQLDAGINATLAWKNVKKDLGMSISKTTVCAMDKATRAKRPTEPPPKTTTRDGLRPREKVRVVETSASEELLRALLVEVRELRMVIEDQITRPRAIELPAPHIDSNGVELHHE